MKCNSESVMAIGLSENNSSYSKFHVANMGLTWVLSAPVGPHSGLLNLAIREYIFTVLGEWHIS